MTNKIPFVGLHAHSTFSTGDGFGYPQEHIDFAVSNGMDALALTDHGTMNGTSYQMLHAKKLKAEGVDFRPIYGIEAYYLDSVSDWKEKYEKLKEDKKIARKLKANANSTVTSETDGSSNRTSILDSLPRYRHLILIAKNQIGLTNIYKMVSASHDEDHFYRRPRMDFALLKKHSEGVICTSACMGGTLSGIFWKHREEGHDAVQKAMTEHARQFVSIFADRYYGEIQWNNIPEQHEINKHIIEMCQKEGIKIVSTADSHYPTKESWESREMYKRLSWISRGKPSWIDDISLPKSTDEIGYELYPKNGDEMWDSYKKYSKECDVEYDDDVVLESIKLTHWIAHEQIEDFEPNTEIQLPNFVIPKGKDADSYLTRIATSSLEKKGLTNKEGYQERLRRELDVIISQGFSKYFLTMKAIADKANETMATGAGRGSAVGCLLSYVLGITQVDPVRFDLPFERFMTKGMTSYPDIDFDVASPALLKKKLADEWGEFSVVPISNWNTLQLKSLIKDLSKFYDIPFFEANEVTQSMMNEATIAAKAKHGIKSGVYIPTFDEVMEFSPTLRKYLQKYPDIETHVNAIYGSIRSCSKHAGGCLIADNLNEKMPLIKTKGTWQTPWSEGQNVRHLEPLGFIKFDILGLSTLEMIQGAIHHILKRKYGVENPTFEEIKEYYSKYLHPDVIDLDDQAVWKNIFHKVSGAPGIFQFTNSGMSQFCEQAMPTNLDELSTVTSLFRPGPLSMGTCDLYLEAKSHPQYIRYDHPILKEILGKTYGLIVFQEDIAMLAHKIGKDISLTDGNKLRKTLTKRGAGKHTEEIYNRFMEGAEEKRIPTKVAEATWEKMEAFAKYGFSILHSTAYSIISYQCAWLCNYYPSEWAASFLDKEPESRKEKAINIIKSLGYGIRSVDVNTSGKVWEISEDGKTLIQPLSSLKGFGTAAIDQVINNRPFNKIEEFLFNENIVYSKLNKKGLDVLCLSGAMDGLIDDRFTGGKHFWTAVCVDRPRKEKNLLENIKEYAPEGEFTESEKIGYLIELTGVFPFDRVMKAETYKQLNDAFIPPVSNYDPKLCECVWFVPRKVVVKKTKTGKTYWVLEVIDDTNNMTRIRCWGVQDADRVFINKPYIAKLEHNEKWGFSTRSLRRNFRVLQ